MQCMAVAEKFQIQRLSVRTLWLVCSRSKIDFRKLGEANSAINSVLVQV